MLPKTLKNYNLFNAGKSCLGEVEELKLPKLTRKLEDYRGGGMDGPVGIDLGQEKLELEFTAGGFMRQVFEQYGSTKADGVMLRFAGAYESDDADGVDAVEVVVRGRHSEIDPGDSKGGDKSKFVVKSALSYYKLSVNGSALIEIDLLHFIFNVNGTDMMAEQRKAIGVA